ncbi:putative cytochrome c oxidase subunit 3 [Mycobacterium xenopi 4042]|uniref:Putative cytochrome c oxidase subunit 3 n=1 Tax=Mycobacterium xenopi 4042 TaxID=1299334 RepID=X8DBZ0_MYCXE|nr:putative cytochrome c oxidase subunit 3 [Mycobacterium xenopi 4042]
MVSVGTIVWLSSELMFFAGCSRCISPREPRPAATGRLTPPT